MSIPVNDLRRSLPLYQTELEKKALEVINSGYYVLGKEVSGFEDEFAAAIGTKYCVGVDNGLNAIMLGVKALGIGAGDEVIVQANTYIATVLGVTANRATPIFVEPTRFYNMDPQLLEQSITPRTKAVLVTHLYGQATEMSLIQDICKRRGLYLLEDCAQSHFAKYKGQTTGTFGAMGFFSFYPTKNLGAIGDGGAVVTDDEELARRIKVLRNYGSSVRYKNDVEGFNSRLDEIQAGFLRVKLKYAQETTAERERIANRYLNEINNSSVTLPGVAAGASHVWHLFVIQVDHRDDFRQYLKERGISTDVHYPTPPHLSDAYQRLGYKRGAFPITEALSEHVVSLPLFNGMSDEEVDMVIEVVNSYGQR